MKFNRDIYYGYIVKGDLHGAIAYVKQFPEQRGLYDRFMEILEQERYIRYEVDDTLNRVLTAYQQYYRDVFFLRIGKEQAADLLRERLSATLGISGQGASLDEIETNQLSDLINRHGLHFLGGRTGGYYGPYIWRTTESVCYEVELTDGIQNYTVKLLDGFITRTWIDYLSFGEIGPGGWTDGDGIINCVRSSYDFESENFKVSLLKHEAQHARDLAMNKDMSSEDLEYRAKLVELIYSKERNLLQTFAQEADPSDPANGHAMAAFRIMSGFADILGVAVVDPALISIEKIQKTARMLFDDSNGGK